MLIIYDLQAHGEKEQEVGDNIYNGFVGEIKKLIPNPLWLPALMDYLDDSH